MCIDMRYTDQTCFYMIKLFDIQLASVYICELRKKVQRHRSDVNDILVYNGSDIYSQFTA